MISRFGEVHELTGVEGEWEGRRLSRRDGADDFEAVLEKVAALFPAGADDGLGVGESFGTLVGAIHSAIGPGGGDTANVSFGRRVIGRHVGHFQERE